VVANGGRQLDLVIITDHRCLIVELKNLDPTLPLTATPNGSWRQRQPDSTDRQLDRNFYDPSASEPLRAQSASPNAR
jgi:Nuclease-related domain